MPGPLFVDLTEDAPSTPRSNSLRGIRDGLSKLLISGSKPQKRKSPSTTTRDDESLLSLKHVRREPLNQRTLPFPTLNRSHVESKPTSPEHSIRSSFQWRISSTFGEKPYIPSIPTGHTRFFHGRERSQPAVSNTLQSSRACSVPKDDAAIFDGARSSFVEIGRQRALHGQGTEQRAWKETQIMEPVDFDAYIARQSPGLPKSQFAAGEEDIILVDDDSVGSPPSPAHLSNRAPAHRAPIVEDEDDGDGVVVIEDDDLFGQAFESDELSDKDFDILMQKNFQRVGPAPEVYVVDDDDDANLTITRKQLSSIQHSGLTFAPGKNAELNDGSFLRIENIYEDATKNVILSGRHLRRSREFEFIATRGTELVWVEEFKENQGSTSKEKKEVAVPLGKVKALRQIIFTNQSWPETSCRDDPDVSSSSHFNRIHGPLFCRWKNTTVYKDEARLLEVAMERITYGEADASARGRDIPRVPSYEIRRKWRGIDTILTGSSFETRQVVDLDGITREEVFQQYSYGDAFCGVGGATRGAFDAGLKIKWGLDRDPICVKTWRLNFGNQGAQCYEVSVDKFLCDQKGTQFMVDVLHISPPCQPWSPAKTVASKDRDHDESNEAALFTIAELVEYIKPRVVTVEQTSGLCTTTKHRAFFVALLRQFVDKSYSFRWKILDLKNFGLAQTRRRLCLIGSGPGEVLPPFPPPTHGPPESGLKPFKGIYDVIRAIPQSATHHDISSTYRFPIPKPKLDGGGFAKTVTCSGGENNYHPGGKRKYTPREGALLNGFRFCHEFGDNTKTIIWRLIGNAVPPVFQKNVLRSCISSLAENDKKELAGDII